VRIVGIVGFNFLNKVSVFSLIGHYCTGDAVYFLINAPVFARTLHLFL